MTADIYYRDEAFFTNEGYIDLLSRATCHLYRDSEDAWLQQVCEAWRSNIGGGRGVGMSDLDLDELASTEAARLRMIDFLQTLRQIFTRPGETIGESIQDRALLDALSGFHKTPTANVANCVDRVLAMLNANQED